MSSKETSAGDFFWLRMNTELLGANSQGLVGPAAHPEAPESEVGEKKLDPAEVLAELYNLLEDYGPTWYTLEHHQKAEGALRLLYRQ